MAVYIFALIVTLIWAPWWCLIVGGLCIVIDVILEQQGWG